VKDENTAHPIPADRKKVFVILTKSFIKIGIEKNIMLQCSIQVFTSTKHLVAAAKFLVAATKNLFVVPNFVAVPKPFFSVEYENFGPIENNS